MFEWNDENKAEVVKQYQDREPTPENSMDIVNEIAEELGATANGVRMILIKNEVYVKKTPSNTASSAKATGGTKRVSKEESQKALADAITAKGLDPDMDIISKLTGKAAVYFSDILS